MNWSNSQVECRGIADISVNLKVQVLVSSNESGTVEGY